MVLEMIKVVSHNTALFIPNTDSTHHSILKKFTEPVTQFRKKQRQSFELGSSAGPWANLGNVFPGDLSLEPHVPTANAAFHLCFSESRLHLYW